MHPAVALQAESSPFVERLLKKGYEVIYLTEPVDEYCIQALPEFDGKRFQNVAKEGVKFDESDKAKEKREAQEKEFEPLTTWLKDSALKDKVGDGFSWRGLSLLHQPPSVCNQTPSLSLPHRSRRPCCPRGSPTRPAPWWPASTAGPGTWRGS